MSKRILFIATLHHPEALREEQNTAHRTGSPLPQFPSSNSYHFYEQELQRLGYVVDVFWRNLPASAKNNPSGAQAQKFEEGMTLNKLVRGVSNRIPAQINPDTRARNAYLLNYAQMFQPDIVWMIGDNTVIYADTLAQLKKIYACQIIYASGTSPIVFSHTIERDSARLYDWVLCNDYYHGIQWQELGAQNMLCLPIAAVDPVFHAPRTLSSEDMARDACEVSFVGTLLPDTLYSERIAALLALSAFKLGIWSVHDIPAALRPFYRGAALGDSMMRVLSASPITVNPHGDFMRYGGNMRLFEAAGLEVFQLVDDRPGVRTWFTEGEHLVIYRDDDDLRAKVTYYLAHDAERLQIAAAARAHVLTHHTYAQRVSALQDRGIL